MLGRKVEGAQHGFHILERLARQRYPVGVGAASRRTLAHHGVGCARADRRHNCVLRQKGGGDVVERRVGLSERGVDRGRAASKLCLQPIEDIGQARRVELGG